jgi:membrane protease YdiL (CAAX protease family)
MTNAISWWTLPRLVVVLLFFPIVLVYLAPEIDVIGRFMRGERELWLAFWLCAAAFEWLVLAWVMTTYADGEYADIGLVRPPASTLVVAVLALSAAIAVAVYLPGPSDEFLKRFPYGATMFFPPPELETRLFWVFMSFTAAFCEETLFRGVAIAELKRLTGSTVAAMVISSVGFVFFHGGLSQGAVVFAVRFALAMMLAVIYLRTKSLAPVMIVHFMMDASALTASDIPA